MSSLFYKVFFKVSNLNKIEKDCREIFKKLPSTTVGSSSGKFSKHYQGWQFYKDSSVPLIQKIVSLLESVKKDFITTFPKKIFSYHHIKIIYVEDTRKLMCLPHKDYGYDGVFHLTVLGNANLSIWSGKRDKKEKQVRVWLDNGTFWYCNGSEYYHTINKYIKHTRGNCYERIEVVIPFYTLKTEEEKEFLSCISECENRFFYPDNPQFIHIQKTNIEFILNKRRRPTPKSPYVIGFLHNIDELSEYSNIIF